MRPFVQVFLSPPFSEVGKRCLLKNSPVLTLAQCEVENVYINNNWYMCTLLTQSFVQFRLFYTRFNTCNNKKIASITSGTHACSIGISDLTCNGPQISHYKTTICDGLLPTLS